MTFLAFLCHFRVDAHAVVADTQREIVRVFECYLHTVTARVRTRISNRLVTNPVDFITNNRMYLSGISIYGKRDLDTTRSATFINRSAKCFGQIVLFRG